MKLITTMKTGSNKGFSLIELIISMALALVVVTVSITFYISGVKNYAQDERYARILANGRYALDTIASDLQMIGYWGELTNPSGITSGSITAGEGCGVNLFNTGNQILYNNGHVGTLTTLFDTTTTNCVTLMGTVQAGTDMLAIKRVEGESITASQLPTVVYLRSNGQSGSLINNANSVALFAGEGDWRYVPRVYYIRDSGAFPSLCRLELNGSGFGAVTQDDCLAEGVEEFHLQFGIDADADGVANRYTENPTQAEINSAVSARIYVLVRSTIADPSYTNAKSYQLGSLTIAAANDNFYRRVFSTTILLRNPANLSQYN